MARFWETGSWRHYLPVWSTNSSVVATFTTSQKESSRWVRGWSDEEKHSSTRPAHLGPPSAPRPGSRSMLWSGTTRCTLPWEGEEHCGPCPVVRGGNRWTREDIVKVLRTAAVDPKFYGSTHIAHSLLSVVISWAATGSSRSVDFKVKKEVKKVREQIQDIVGHHDVEREQADQCSSQSTDSQELLQHALSRNCSEGIKPPISEVRTERSEQSLEKLPL